MSEKKFIIKNVVKDYYRGKKHGACMICNKTLTYMSEMTYQASTPTSGNGRLHICCNCFESDSKIGNSGYTEDAGKYSKNILQHNWTIEVLAHENESFYLLDKSWIVTKRFELNKVYYNFRLVNQLNKHKIGAVIKNLLEAGYTVRIYLKGEKKPRRIHNIDEYYNLTETIVR